jgi:methionyl-tRNA formyltransferase
MKIVFAGTPEFAAAALEALHLARHEIALVLTQPDRPAGRGLKQRISPVKRLAQALGLEVRQPATLRDPALSEALKGISPEAIVVVAYGLIVPPPLLAIPPRGWINVHGSLLPRWRGAAPIQRALLAGDRETGISIMRMDAGLDTGPVMLEERTPILPEDTAQTLHDRLAAMGGRLIVRALAEWPETRPQDDALATYAPRIEKREALIDWREPAVAIERKVRAFDPAPGAVTTYAGEPLKIWRVCLAQGAGGAPPGTVCHAGSGGIVVACGADEALRVLELQRAGGKRLSAAAFLAGAPLAAGARFGGG